MLFGASTPSSNFFTQSISSIIEYEDEVGTADDDELSPTVNKD